MRIDTALALSQTLVGDEAKVDVEHLLCEVLDQSRAYLYIWPERELNPEQIARFTGLLEQRRNGVPVAHILGRRAFWDFELEVNGSTLIPRADTEALVEEALSLVASEPLRVADLGTGTGAVALALARERPFWDVWGCDKIPEAVALARRNAERLRVQNLTFVDGSWFEPLEGKFDLIVSNPPYIDPDDPHLGQGDLRFEPLTALTAADHGLADIEHIIKQARHHLNRAGWVVLEHGFDQAERVAQLFASSGFCNIRHRRDYGGNMRVTAGQIEQA